MIPVPKERSTIQVDPETLKIFRAACEAMPQQPKMSRVAIGLARWFARQGQVIKTAVISGVDEGMELVYASALRAAADELERRAIKRVGEVTSKGPAGTPAKKLVGSPQK
jgi:hypothetical protein